MEEYTKEFIIDEFYIHLTALYGLTDEVKKTEFFNLVNKNLFNSLATKAIKFQELSNRNLKIRGLGNEKINDMHKHSNDTVELIHKIVVLSYLMNDEDLSILTETIKEQYELYIKEHERSKG